MSKITIIQLLNKIANGEELPKKIYCFDREFYLTGNTYFGDTFTLMHYIQEDDLNDEVEIIEEDKKIPEKITINENGIIGFPNGQWTARNMDKAFAMKINSIIDYLKSKGE